MKANSKQPIKKLVLVKETVKSLNVRTELNAGVVIPPTSVSIASESRSITSHSSYSY